MIKNYILDTNVLIYDPESIFNFEDNNVIISIMTINELDKLKSRLDDVGVNSRKVSDIINNLSQYGNLYQGVKVSNNGTFRIEINMSKEFNSYLDLNNNDNKLLATAKYIENQSNNIPVILVTKDKNLKILANVFNITCQDYLNKQIEFSTVYSGIYDDKIYVDSNIIDELYKFKYMNVSNVISDNNIISNLYPNQFLILKANNNDSKSIICRYFKNKIFKIRTNNKLYGITANNKEQHMALDLLLNDDISIVTLLGNGGSGKSLLTLISSLQKIIKEKVYSRILIIRPIIAIGNDIGYLPGDKETKLRNWYSAIYDNLEYIDYINGTDFSSNESLIKLESIVFVRGRSLTNQLIFIDDSQSFNPEMIDIILSRVGKGSKIIFAGDVNQIDNKYLDKRSNGLTYIIEESKHKDFSGHITLEKIERSIVAEFASELQQKKQRK